MVAYALTQTAIGFTANTFLFMPLLKVIEPRGRTKALLVSAVSYLFPLHTLV